MKLPPLALIAPSLCPRCDQPAMILDHSEEARCGHCGLQLHQCGNCRGIAGGFCGHELVRGEQRPIWWRLWLVAALVPLVGALIGGIWWAQAHPIK